jgi:hypothetical protein
MSDLYKKCPECSRWLENRKFYKDPTKEDGLMSWCKSCVNCDVVRDRPAYGDGERQWGDPTEKQIANACLQFQASWSPAVRESRKKPRLSAAALRRPSRELEK